MSEAFRLNFIEQLSLYANATYCLNMTKKFPEKAQPKVVFDIS